MGGLEIFLSAICFNATFCGYIEPTDSFNNIELPTKAQKLQEIKDFYNGRHLKIGTVQNRPLSCAIRSTNGTYQGCGVAFQFVNILQEMFNFTYEVVLPRQNFEGSKSNHEDSLLGMLNRSEIDMAAAFLPVLSDSSDFVKYSSGLDEGVWVIMMKRPKASASSDGLTAPFDKIVWCMIVVAVLSFGPCIYLMIWVRYITTKDDLNKPYKLAPCYWFVYGALIKQGSTLSPDANTTRVLFATWWIFITLLSAFYTANLTAFLTLSQFTLSINEPKDLAKKNYKWIARKGSAVEYVVTNPDEDLFFLNKMVEKKRAMFQTEIYDAAYLPYVNDDYVYVRDQPAVDHLMYDDYKNKTKENINENLRCTYVVTENSFMKKPRAFAYPRNSSFNLIADPVLLSLVESGIVKYKTSYDLPGNKICPLNLKSTERQLTNNDLSMTYIVAGTGIAIAAVSFIFEVLYHHRQKLCGVMFGHQLDEGDNKVKPWDKDNAINFGKESPGPPPPYQSIFQTINQSYGSMYNNGGKRQYVNGREYWVLRGPAGDTRLIPVRTPSAFLFQYST